MPDIDLNTPEVKQAIEDAVAAKVKEVNAALEANRDTILKEKKALERRLKDLDGIDPEEHKALKTAAEEAEKKKAAAEGNWKALEQQLQERHTKELGKREDRIKGLSAALERELIDAAATRAIAAEKGAVDLLLPHVRTRMRVVEEDGSYVAIVVDEKGNQRIGEKDGTKMSAEELVREMKSGEKYARAFDGSGASGSGASRSEAGGGAVRSIPSGDDKAFLANLDKIAKGDVKVEA